MTDLKPKKYNIDDPAHGVIHTFEYGTFIALEYFDGEGQKRRLYGRVTETLINDPHFRFMIVCGLYTVITDLTPEEKEHIYNTCI